MTAQFLSLNMPLSRKSSISSVSKRKSFEATSADITSIARTLSNKHEKENGERKSSMEKGTTKSIQINAEQSTLDEWEQIEDDEEEGKSKSSRSRSKGKHKYGNIKFS